MPRWLHWLAHSWRRVRCMGAWEYWECRHCGERQATRWGRPNGPRSMTWLAGGDFDNSERRPPQGGTAPLHVQSEKISCSTPLNRTQKAVAHAEVSFIHATPEVVGLRQMVRDRNDMIRELRERLSEKDALIADMKAAGIRADARIAELTAVVSQGLVERLGPGGQT
jgi:hypothetical protein